MPVKPAVAGAAQTASDAPQTAQNQGGGGVVATQGAYGLAVPADWAAELAKEAKDEAAKERPSVSKISLRAGQMTYMGNTISGNAMEVVVAAVAFRNTYYPDKFNPNEIKNPSCFAIAADEEDLEAHENVPDENVPERKDPDLEGGERSCDNCTLGEWGTAPDGGRGKGCKEGRRLVVMPATALNSVEDVLKAEFAILDLPVTSVKNYSNFVNALAASINVPAWAAVTRIEVRPDPKSQFKVYFTPMRVVADGDLLTALRKRKDEALRIAMTPWDEAFISAPNYKGQEQKGKKF